MLQLESKEEFDKIVVNIKGDDPIYILFKAPWCPTCARISTIMDSKSFNCYSVDTSIEPNKPIAQKYRVNFVPTLLILKNDGISVSGETVVGPIKILEKINSMNV